MKRLFNDQSFWNQRIGGNPCIDPESAQLLEFMTSRESRGFWLNLTRYTIPIYEVDGKTPRRKVYKRLLGDCTDWPWMNGPNPPRNDPGDPLGHERKFAEDAAAGRIPIPDYGMPDKESDAHMSLVDRESGWIWDMWYCRRRGDGDWETLSGIKYRADGSGVFDRRDFAPRNGDSIHQYGPCRAAGVPAIAGMIMHDEVLDGRIEHRLSFCTHLAALQRFVHPPACWTDGGWRQGMPEGAVLQLDPGLDLARLGLSPGAMVVARALQEYGTVCVDVGQGYVLYAEGLYADPRKRSWDGLLKETDLSGLKLLPHFRVLKMEGVVEEGMAPRKPDGGIYAGED
jgi:hypothetical protein